MSPMPVMQPPRQRHRLPGKEPPPGGACQLPRGADSTECSHGRLPANQSLPPVLRWRGPRALFLLLLLPVVSGLLIRPALTQSDVISLDPGLGNLEEPSDDGTGPRLSRLRSPVPGACPPLQFYKVRVTLADDIIATLRKKGFTRAADAFQSTGILQTSFTKISLLVPTNDAFSKLPGAVKKILKDPAKGPIALKKLLLEHMLTRAKSLNRFRSGPKNYTTFLGSTVEVSPTTVPATVGFTAVDGFDKEQAVVTSPDLLSNCLAVAQGIDAVLIPSRASLLSPLPPPRPKPHKPYICKVNRTDDAVQKQLAVDLVNTLSALGYSEAAAAYNLTGVLRLIHHKASILAPTDAAFGSLPTEIKAVLADPVLGPQALSKIMRYHMLNRSQTASELTRRPGLYTTYLRGRRVIVTAKPKNGIRNLGFAAFKGFSSEVAWAVAPELFTHCFGHVQGIDAVLLPAYEVLVPPSPPPPPPAPAPVPEVAPFPEVAPAPASMPFYYIPVSGPAPSPEPFPAPAPSASAPSSSAPSSSAPSPSAPSPSAPSSSAPSSSGPSSSGPSSSAPSSSAPSSSAPSSSAPSSSTPSSSAPALAPAPAPGAVHTPAPAMAPAPKPSSASGPAHAPTPSPELDPKPAPNPSSPAADALKLAPAPAPAPAPSPEFPMTAPGAAPKPSPALAAELAPKPGPSTAAAPAQPSIPLLSPQPVPATPSSPASPSSPESSTSNPAPAPSPYPTPFHSAFPSPTLVSS